MSTNYVNKEYLIKNFQNFADKLKTIYQKQENVEFHVVDSYSKLASNPKVSMVSYVIDDETVGTDIKKKGFYYYDIKEATPKWIYIEISGGNGLELKPWISGGKPYSKDEYVVYDYKLYQANKNHTSSANFELDKTNWNLIIGGNSYEVFNWKTDYDYVVGNRVKYNNYVHECIADHHSDLTDFDNDKDNWIIELDKYYNVTKKQYDNMVKNGLITANTKHLYVVSDDSNSNSYFTTTSPVTNKIGQFELDEEYTEADKVTINEVLNKLLHVNIKPEIVFELVGNDTLLEIGQTIPVVNLRVAFTKIGNGNITNIQFYKNGVKLGSSQTFIDGITEYTNNTDRSISSDTTYKVIVTYNFGKGDKTLEKEINVKFVRRSFYGTTQDNSFMLNSDNIRTLTGSKLGIKKGDKFNININSGDVQVIIAYPKEIGDINSIKYIEGMNAEIKDTFTKQIIQVKDLGTTLTDYNVYVYKPINPYSKNATYVATI